LAVVAVEETVLAAATVRQPDAEPAVGVGLARLQLRRAPCCPRIVAWPRR
jgi:hypothetical protein